MAKVDPSISEKLADAARRASGVPREVVEKLLIDVAGLCVAARKEVYVRAAMEGWEASGKCTAIGHARALDAGTTTHPYIDCARRLSKKLNFQDIEEIVCEAAQGTLHRLWEPLAAKQRPPSPARCATRSTRTIPTRTTTPGTCG